MEVELVFVVVVEEYSPSLVVVEELVLFLAFLISLIKIKNLKS